MLIKVNIEVLIFGESKYNYEKTKLKLLLFKKCNSCKDRKLCTYIEEEQSNEIKHYYCSDCGEDRKRFHAAHKEFLTKVEQHANAIDNKMSEEKKRFDYLKKEVELFEIEEKAKLYGITYPGSP
ncbi:hypothetical protein ACOMCU_16300 [Lysinibacillus sp. UGB7]|uniref:hypothetical protein n=1 Tax=Lysinibacillus sp. UGB7 TaxID=3411039 RepID=UPI003B7F040C